MGCASSSFLFGTQPRVIFVKQAKNTEDQEETETEDTNATKLAVEIPKENEHFISFADKDGTINQADETGSGSQFVRSISLSGRKQTRQEKHSPHRSVSLSAWESVNKMKRNGIPSTSLGQFGPCDCLDTSYIQENDKIITDYWRVSDDESATGNIVTQYNLPHGRVVGV
ncbi:hypothetical protein AC249_AIPGENE2267 [Exaiptasia diaphana]|nr:hypothetical protein AC249_AIPGENE2267 [Exaiptasia diaphana]